MRGGTAKLRMLVGVLLGAPLAGAAVGAVALVLLGEVAAAVVFVVTFAGYAYSAVYAYLVAKGQTRDMAGQGGRAMDTEELAALKRIAEATEKNAAKPTILGLLGSFLSALFWMVVIGIGLVWLLHLVLG